MEEPEEPLLARAEEEQEDNEGDKEEESKLRQRRSRVEELTAGPVDLYALKTKPKDASYLVVTPSGVRNLFVRLDTKQLQVVYGSPLVNPDAEEQEEESSTSTLHSIEYLTNNEGEEQELNVDTFVVVSDADPNGKF